MVREHWTIPVNMRLEDKPVLDAALNIAKEERTDITKIFRTALSEFVGRRAGSADTRKIDEFLDKRAMSDRICNQILKPAELRNWSDENLLEIAKVVRARLEELDSELRRRGYFFRWM